MMKLSCKRYKCKSLVHLSNKVEKQTMYTLKCDFYTHLQVIEWNTVIAV